MRMPPGWWNGMFSFFSMSSPRGTTDTISVGVSDGAMFAAVVSAMLAFFS